MKKLSILFLFLSAKAFAQPCDCPKAFNSAIAIITTNYAGYKDKVRPDNEGVYRAYTDSFLRAAADPKYFTEANCAGLIRSWIGFFKDSHVQVFLPDNTPKGLVNKDSIRNLYKKAEVVTITEAAYKNYLRTSKNLHLLEAIWLSSDGQYKIGIKNENNILKGFIVKADSIYWMPGQVKMKIYNNDNSLSADFYAGDHSIRKAEVGLYSNNNILMGARLGVWNRIDINTDTLADKTYYTGKQWARFEKLSDKTSLITIRSFTERALIDSIVKANHATISSTENLIIDVRGNGGGSDYSYHPLKKYLFTHPYQRVTAAMLCSEENIDRYRRFAKDTFFTKEERAEFLERITKMEEHKNKFWSSSPVYISSDTIDLLPYPKRVAVIIDGNCASTTEQFLLDPVANSNKAIIYGQPSAGVLDYANMNGLRLLTTNIRLLYATSRSHRIDIGKGIDNKGVQPNVLIDKKVKDWVSFVQKELEGKK